MKDVNFFELTADSDTTEGRGRSFVVARFVNKSDAVKVNDDERFYKKYGVMGTQQNAEYAVSEFRVHVYESAQEYFDNHDLITLKENALKKLTAAERKALGY